MENNLWIKIIDKGYKLSQEIYIVRSFNGRTEILRDNSWYPVDVGAIDQKPTLELMPQELQGLADALAEKGIKPQEGFLEGKIEATEKHLEDMRKLVFK